MMETILLTGFGPFGPHERNISAEAVARFDGTELEGFQIRTLQLPVQFERATSLLDEALAQDPAAVICFGIHDDDASYRVELAAKNERHYSRPDVDGAVVEGGVVREGGPAMVFSSLPVAAIKQRLAAAGLDAQLSEDAGRYLCNAVFYWVAQRREAAGFIHVPAAPEHLENVVKAVDVVVKVTAERLIAQRVEATAS